MKLTSRELGNEAEKFAAQLLMGHGLKLLEQNVNYRVGEIDLIMKDRELLVFVEVRRRKHEHFGGVATSPGRPPRRDHRPVAAISGWSGRPDKLRPELGS